MIQYYILGISILNSALDCKNSSELGYTMHDDPISCDYRCRFRPNRDMTPIEDIIFTMTRYDPQGVMSSPFVRLTIPSLQLCLVNRATQHAFPSGCHRLINDLVLCF